jgi:hypothetical protein
VDRVLGALRFWSGERSARRGYEAYLESRALECGEGRKGGELEQEWRALRRGWYLGGRSFAERLLEAVGRGREGRRAASLSGEAVVAHGEGAAERWLATAAEALGWTGRDWRQGAKVTVQKQVLAWWLRSRTGVSCRWISERLGMGHESSVSRAAAVVRAGGERQVRRWKGVLSRVPAPAATDLTKGGD